MKIGRFSEENNISLDTIRHYMDLGLIIPNRIGGQYEFDETCKRDLQEVIELKEMGFSLSEIRGVFFFKRLAKLTPYQESEYYREFFTKKYNHTADEVNRLLMAKKKLGEKIEEISSVKRGEGFKIGIDLRFLSFLKCIRCGGEMVLSDGRISSNQVIDGKLECSCGRSYRIDDGILIVDPISTSCSDFIEGNIGEYISTTSMDYLDNLCRSMEWVNKRLDFSMFKGSVFLDLGSGMGFGLRNIYDSLPDKSYYIAVDRDLSKHKFLKNVLETSEHRKNIIFICSDFLRLPIREKLVDVVMDFTGTSNFSFENERFLLKLVDRYVKNDAFLVGSYILFKNFSINSLISGNLRNNFSLEKVKEQINSLGYDVIEERVSGYIEEGGKYESYFKKGEKVFTYVFYGKR